MLKKLSTKQRLLITIALIGLLCILWLGGSIFNLIHNKLEVRRLTKKRNLLDAQYQELLDEKKLLEEKDAAYLELLARTRYNMVKPGEIEFRLKQDD